MFEDLEKKIEATPIQGDKKGKVQKKKAGRKPKPNMGKFIFKMDKIRHKKLKEKAKNLGADKSAIVNMLVQEWLDK